MKEEQKYDKIEFRTKLLFLNLIGIIIFTLFVFTLILWTIILFIYIISGVIYLIINFSIYYGRKIKKRSEIHEFTFKKIRVFILILIIIPLSFGCVGFFTRDVSIDYLIEGPSQYEEMVSSFFQQFQFNEYLAQNGENTFTYNTYQRHLEIIETNNHNIGTIGMKINLNYNIKFNLFSEINISYIAKQYLAPNRKGQLNFMFNDSSTDYIVFNDIWWNEGILPSIDLDTDWNIMINDSIYVQMEYSFSSSELHGDFLYSFYSSELREGYFWFMRCMLTPLGIPIFLVSLYSCLA